MKKRILQQQVVYPYQLQEEISCKNISYQDTKVQPEQTENDAQPAKEKFKGMRELKLLKKKAKREMTYCKDCEGMPTTCLDCFNEKHS